MKLRDTPLPGVVVVEPERVSDERGHFARTFCAQEFAAAGLEPAVAQCNTSYNALAGTVRGMHFQAAPHGEAKLVRATRGVIYDVAVDLRSDALTFLSWFGITLSQDNGLALFVPVGCAHGFQTLTDDTEVLYQMSKPFVHGAQRGVRYDDPAFAIDWPAPPPNGRVISERDATYADFAG